MKNTQRSFDSLQKDKLGSYIYALRDPRDKKVFYIGQGINNRIFDHFNEADYCLKKSLQINQLSSKIIRILDIWKNNEDVEWFIVSHNLPDLLDISDYIESALVDCLSESQNGETLNEVAPPKSSRLWVNDLEAMAAPFVNPPMPIKRVFVFPIQNALNVGTNPYNATRTTWYVSDYYRGLRDSYAVGLKNSISKGSFEILKWSVVHGTRKHEFTSPGHPNPTDFEPLLNMNWNNVLAIAKGFWQRGNYLIVEFDGCGRFKIIRGAQDTNWHNC